MGVPQRPDFLLELAELRVVLDAKYRVDTSPAYLARYAAPGPPEDALHTLHRYRDALRLTHAIALFPGHRPGRLAASARSTASAPSRSSRPRRRGRGVAGSPDLARTIENDLTQTAQREPQGTEKVLSVSLAFSSVPSV
jgi:hypothetical protein